MVEAVQIEPRSAVPRRSVAGGHGIGSERGLESASGSRGDCQPPEGDTVRVRARRRAAVGSFETPDVPKPWHRRGLRTARTGRSLSGDGALHVGMDFADERVRARGEGGDQVGDLLARGDLALEHARARDASEMAMCRSTGTATPPRLSSRAGADRERCPAEVTTARARQAGRDRAFVARGPPGPTSRTSSASSGWRHAPRPPSTPSNTNWSSRPNPSRCRGSCSGLRPPAC